MTINYKDLILNFDKKLDKIQDSIDDVNKRVIVHDITLYGKNNNGLENKVEDLSTKVEANSRSLWKIGFVASFFGAIISYIWNK